MAGGGLAAYRHVQEGSPRESSVQRRNVGSRLAHKSLATEREASEQTSEEDEPLQLIVDVTLANHKRKSHYFRSRRRRADVITTSSTTSGL